MSHLMRIGVVRGGPSAEHEVSMATGANILRILRERYPDKYHPTDIFINKDGGWHVDGVEVSPYDLHHRVDVAFLGLHGAYGEDGKIQHLLECHGIPFTGSGSLASAVGMNKLLSKKTFDDHDIKVPFHWEVSSREAMDDQSAIVERIFQTIILPVVIKPSASGSSVGVTLVKDFNHIPEALTSAAIHGDTIIIEQYIPGVEATCGVVEDFRGQELYTLPPIEIRPATPFFDYDAKYKGQSQEIVPATFAHEIKEKIQGLSAKIHRALGLRHYSRSDFIIHPRRGIYALEVNTLPGLTDESLFPKSLRAIGSDTHELVDHLIGLAMKR